MKVVTSVSGGKSSAYIAANYPADHLVFALVCIDDPQCKPKDKKLVQMVSDRIGREFVATAEDDTILHTMLDLEQFVGQQIDWVVGPSFDELISANGGFLPNVTFRYCTWHLKMTPLFEWWQKTIGERCVMQIGFRANEMARAQRMMNRCNDDGFIEHKHVVGKHPSGKNKWDLTAWEKPSFPLIDDRVFRDNIESFWKNKTVQFAERNNCVGCFHRNPLLLRQMWDSHPNKMDWFMMAEEQSERDGRWKKEVSYKVIKQHELQFELDFDNWSDCDSGHCGL